MGREASRRRRLPGLRSHLHCSNHRPSPEGSVSKCPAPARPTNPSPLPGPGCLGLSPLQAEGPRQDQGSSPPLLLRALPDTLLCLKAGPSHPTRDLGLRVLSQGPLHTVVSASAWKSSWPHFRSHLAKGAPPASLGPWHSVVHSWGFLLCQPTRRGPRPWGRVRVAPQRLMTKWRRRWSGLAGLGSRQREEPGRPGQPGEHGQVPEAAVPWGAGSRKFMIHPGCTRVLPTRSPEHKAGTQQWPSPGPRLPAQEPAGHRPGPSLQRPALAPGGLGSWREQEVGQGGPGSPSP